MPLFFRTNLRRVRRIHEIVCRMGGYREAALTSLSVLRQEGFNGLRSRVYGALGQSDILTAPAGERADNQTLAHFSGQAVLPTGWFFDDYGSAETLPNRRIAVHVHAYYPDIFERIMRHLVYIPQAFDLIITTDTQDKSREIHSILSDFPSAGDTEIIVVPNRGRDIAPFLISVGPRLLQYDLALHLHTKRSPYESDLKGWMGYLLQGLLQSPVYVESVLRLFDRDKELGALGPAPFPPVIKYMDWANCRPLAEHILGRIGMDAANLPTDPLNFPAGSMFWFRPDALKPLLEADLTCEDFPPEAAQRNNTIAHAIERLFYLIINRCGYKTLTSRPAHPGDMFIPLLEDGDDDSNSVFPAPATPGRPMVSIIIPVYNQWVFTRHCIQSIIRHTDPEKTPYEIIVADDRSTDGTDEKVQIFGPHVRIHRTEGNLGFLKNCNAAASTAAGAYFVFLNNDTQVQPNWLSAITDAFAKNSDAGLVGSKLIYPQGSLQEVGGVVWKDGGALNYGRNGDPSQPDFCYLRKSDYVSGAAITIRRELWEEIGGFDERFAPAYYEDTDLAFAVRDKGYQVYVQPASLIVHFEGISHGTDTDTGIKAYQVANKQKFLEKWNEALAADGHTGAMLFKARERATKQKTVVFLDFLLPEVDRHAGARHTMAYVELLRGMGYVVKFLAIRLEDARQLEVASKLRQRQIETFHPYQYFSTVAWHQWLDHNHTNIDLVIINRPLLARNYLTFCKQRNLPVIYMCHDIEGLRTQREVEQTGNTELLTAAKLQLAQERDFFRLSDHVLTPSTFEKAYAEAEFGVDTVSAVPLFLYDRSPVPLSAHPPGQDIIFVGGFAHFPNSDGVRWFLEKVWSQVLNACPAARFHIVGKNVPEEIETFRNENVFIHGGVSDDRLMELYAASSAAVIPLRFGAGVKGKVIEAMYQGTPIISTSCGLEGISGIEGILAGHDTPEDFAQEVIKLLSLDAAEWLSFSEKQQSITKDRYSVEYGQQVMRSILRSSINETAISEDNHIAVGE